MAAAVAPLGPQAAGAAGGVVPFWAASHDVLFDAFTSDSWTPGSAVADLFQGALAELKSYGYASALWLKFTSASGSGAGTFAADGPMNALSIIRVQDPNGHAIIDCDGFGLYLLNKYGGYSYVGDPADLSNASFAMGGTTGASAPQFDLLVPFPVNSEIGFGAISDMDASGPYQIIAQGNTSAAIYSTVPASTIPTLTIAVGGEFYSLPAAASRVNGQPQVYLPPLLDRGLAVVKEYTKTTLTGISSNVPLKLRRVGNLLSRVILVARNSSGARISWTSSALNSGARIQLAFDSVPLWDADPQHVIDLMARRSPRGQSLDTGVLVFDRHASAKLKLDTLGVDAGLDKLLQTAQTTDLTVQSNFNTTNLNSIDVYTEDITITNLVTGEKFSYAYGGQMLMPAQASIRS